MLRMVETAGTVVVGGGVVGAAVARTLSRRGESTLLVEGRTPAHRAGSSHGDSRIFRFSYPEPEYLAMAERAHSGWRELERETGATLLHETGGWECGPERCPELAARRATLAAAGHRAEVLSAEESAGRFPQIAVPAGAEVLYQPETALLAAERAVVALWETVERAGGRTRRNETVLGIEAGSGGVVLGLGQGRRIRAARAVVAVGGWSRPLLKTLDLDLPLAVTREQVAYFAPKPGAPADIDHRVGKMPTVMDYHTTKPFYSLPQLEVPGVKAGWHHAGTAIASAEEESGLDEENLAAVASFVCRRLPHLDPRPILKTTCLYTSTPDLDFILDRHPTEPALTIAAGFSGHGFKFGPVLGEILAALALGSEPPVRLERFALGRFTR